MCLTRRLTIVPKNTTANATQTSVIRMSIGHSASAYSLAWVMPSGNVIATATITSLPAPEHERGELVAEQARLAGALHDVVAPVAISAQPPNAKITAFVCSGRSRP